MSIVATLCRAAIAGALSLSLSGCLTTANIDMLTENAMTLVGSMDTSVEKQKHLAFMTTSQILNQSPESVDTEMEQKLQRMVDRIVEANGLEEFDYKVHLLSTSNINAFTPGAGVIFVEEGLVAQATTEAMMAMVLAHEIAHIVKAHPIEGMRDRSILNIGGVAVSEYVGSQTTGFDRELALMLVDYTHRAAVSGYGRAAESEADRLGFEYYVKAGYKPASAPDIFHEFSRIFGAAPVIDHFFHGTHPQSHERASRLRKLVLDMEDGLTRDGIEQTPEWEDLAGRYANRRI